MSHIIAIWHNQLGKPSSLIGIADNYIDVDKIIQSHIDYSYPAHKPRIVCEGAIYKVDIGTSDKVIKSIHYSTELLSLNSRRV